MDEKLFPCLSEIRTMILEARDHGESILLGIDAILRVIPDAATPLPPDLCDRIVKANELHEATRRPTAELCRLMTLIGDDLDDSKGFANL